MISVRKEFMINYIKAAVNEGKITVYAISKATNINQTTIHNIVKGVTLNPHNNNIIMIYNFLIEKLEDDDNAKFESIKEDNPTITKQGVFDKLLDEKIEEMVKKLTDQKFKEINEHLSFLLRKVYELNTGDKDDLISEYEKIG